MCSLVFKEILFKDIFLVLALHEEHFSKKKIEFEPVVQEMLFKNISYPEVWQPLFQRSKIIYAILAEGIMKNISVKLF